MDLNCNRPPATRGGYADRRLAVRTLLPATLLIGVCLAAWAAPGAAQEDAGACANGVVVPEPDNHPDLVADCEVLLALRDRYADDADLDWSADTPISEWEDIVVEDFVLTELDLTGKGLTGPVPTEVAQLARLQVLFLKDNELTGTFPAELLAMTNLTGLSLSQNELTGTIPPELGKLANLEELVLHNNILGGPIPPELGQLSNLKTLWLNNNELTAISRPS